MSKLKKRWHYIKTWKLAYPVMLSQFGQVMVGQADSIMVGRLGTIPLAAATLANSIFVVVMVFGIGISFAISPLIASADGEKNHQRIRDVVKHAVVLNIVLSILLYALVTAFTFGIDYLGQDPAVANATHTYMHIINASLVPLILFFSLRQFAEGLSDTKFAMYITVGANVLNVILNYLFIYGKFGFPALGLEGAGWATLIARVLQFLGMWIIIVRIPKFAAYWSSIRWSGFKINLYQRILALGIPSGLQMVFEVGAFAFSAMMIGWISAEAQAAHNIAISLASISYMIATGLAAAATVRVGNQLGRRDMPNLREAGFVVFKITLIIMIVSGILFLLGKDFLPRLYINEQEVISIASSLLVVAVMFQLSDGQQAVALGALRGLADVKVPTFIVFAAYWLFALPVSYLLGIYLEMGAVGVWYGLAVGLTFSAIFLTWRFVQKTKSFRTALA
jgi:MATE family multidrug resistance protein